MGGPPPEPPGRGGGTFSFFHGRENLFFFKAFFIFRARKGRKVKNAKNPKSENVTKTRFSRFFKGPGATIFL